MTICRSLDARWCYQCEHYEAINSDFFGVCICNDSTHCEHVITERHVACKHFEESQ